MQSSKWVYSELLLFLILSSAPGWGQDATSKPPALLPAIPEAKLLIHALPPKRTAIRDPNVVPIPDVDLETSKLIKERQQLPQRIIVTSYDADNKAGCDLNDQQKNTQIILVGENHRCPQCGEATLEHLDALQNKIAIPKAGPNPEPKTDSSKLSVFLKRAMAVARARHKVIQAKNRIYAHEGFYIQTKREGNKEVIVQDPSSLFYGIESPIHHSTNGLVMALQSIRRTLAKTNEKAGIEVSPGRMIGPVSEMIDTLILDRNMGNLFAEWVRKEKIRNAKNVGVKESALVLGLDYFLDKTEKLLGKASTVSDDEYLKITKNKQEFLFEITHMKKEEFITFNFRFTEFIQSTLVPFLELNRKKFNTPDLTFLKENFLSTDTIKTSMSEREALDWRVDLQLNFDWRNQPLADNILRLFCKAALEGKELHVTVGQLHIPGLVLAMKEKLIIMGVNRDTIQIDPGFKNHSWNDHFVGEKQEDIERHCKDHPYNREFENPAFPGRYNEAAYYRNTICFMFQNSN